MIRLLWFFVSLIIGLSSLGAAHADVDPELARQALKNAEHLSRRVALASVQRIRRSLAVGPTLSGAVRQGQDDKSFSDHVGIGLSLYKFRVPTPLSFATLQKLLGRRLFSEVMSRLEGAEVKPTQAEVAAFVEDVWGDIREELLGDIRGRGFERPALALAVAYEGSIADSAHALAVTGSIGLGPVLMSVGIKSQVAPNAVFIIPLEISVPLTLGTGERTRVADIFLRYDRVVLERDKGQDHVAVGLKFLFSDLI